MEKTKSRFIIIGSGWRAMYYARIAAALDEENMCRLWEARGTAGLLYGDPSGRVH